MILVGDDQGEALVDFLRVNKEMVEEMVNLLNSMVVKTELTEEEIEALKRILAKHKSLKYYCRKFDSFKKPL